MEGHLPDKIKEERAGIIKKISAEKINTFLKSNIGSEQEVLLKNVRLRTVNSKVLQETI